MFRKLLVANRGEIAVRVLRTAREMGLTTVAVYSEADRGALHVRLADEAYCIGPPPARESYLDGERILQVARQAGVDAIHPGYGFLSENADFAERCEAEGIAFVGPPPAAVRAMGDKLASRRLVQRHGVPAVPGSEELKDEAEALASARELGYPLLVKASAGGGGRGMRTVGSPEELPNALLSARAEATAAFGDDTLYLEKLIKPVRHVEMQVIGDRHGSLFGLGERECSIQRRHQKIIEEAPSPVMTPELRARMAAAAVATAGAVGYYSAGTVEFLVDAELNFYFLEMNTRLQVEHPITELVTGVDLVADQIRVAAGEPLGYDPESIVPRGWAIECRITTEDPFNNFMPSVGRVRYVSEPSGPGVRLDSALFDGFEVSAYYDSLVAKLCTWGRDRAEAIRRMRRALREFTIIGVSTTIPFHLQVMEHPAFVAGALDTDFVDKQFTPSTNGQPEDQILAVLGAAVIAHLRKGSVSDGRASAAAGGPAAVRGWRMAGRLSQLRGGSPFAQRPWRRSIG